MNGIGVSRRTTNRREGERGMGEEGGEKRERKRCWCHMWEGR